MFSFIDSDHIEQIRVTVILNEVETSSTAEQMCRRREFTEVSDHRDFSNNEIKPNLIGAALL